MNQAIGIHFVAINRLASRTHSKTYERSLTIVTSTYSFCFYWLQNYFQREPFIFNSVVFLQSLLQAIMSSQKPKRTLVRQPILVRSNYLIHYIDTSNYQINIGYASELVSLKWQHIYTVNIVQAVQVLRFFSSERVLVRVSNTRIKD